MVAVAVVVMVAVVMVVAMAVREGAGSRFAFGASGRWPRAPTPMVCIRGSCFAAIIPAGGRPSGVLAPALRREHRDEKRGRPRE